MQNPARLQAAIEILDQVIAAAQSGGAAADTLIQRYFAARRYAGSKDRAAVREMVYSAIRFTAERPANGRAAMLGLAQQRPELLELFDGSGHGPALPVEGEAKTEPSLVPLWMKQMLHDRFAERFQTEVEGLISRAPLDLRVSPRKGDPALIAAELGATALPGLPYGLRLDVPVSLEHHPLMREGVIEVQDAASQMAAAFAAAAPGETVIDLCAGAGGKTLALAESMKAEGRLIATDTDRGRLQSMAPRLTRAGLSAFVEVRLLDGGREGDRMADLIGLADVVLVDAPCSGTGTWRRNPELRWRLEPRRLEQLLSVQQRLIDFGAKLVKPGGRLIYAVCSVLDAEGREQAEAAESRLGFTKSAERALSPASDGSDGFYVAQLDRQ